MTPVVVHPSEDAPARIADDFQEDPKLLKPILGGMMVTFIPRWIKCYDSYEIPDAQKEMRDIDFSQDPVPFPCTSSVFKGKNKNAERSEEKHIWKRK